MLILYLLLPSASYTGDGTLFADLVRQFGNDRSVHYFRLLLHPHHLLYGPLAVGFVQALGQPPESLPYSELVRMSHLSSFLSALALGVFFMLLRQATRSTALPLAATLLLAFSHSFWSFSVGVEVQSLMLATLILFLLALALTVPDTRGAALLGALHGLAILAHVVLALLVLPALVQLLRPPSPGRSPGGHGQADVARRLAAYGLCAILTVGIPYAVAVPFLGVETVADFMSYLEPSYSASGYLSSPLSGARKALTSLEAVFLYPSPAHYTDGSLAMGLGWLRTALRLLLTALLLGSLFLRRRAELSHSALRLRSAAALTLLALLPLWTMWDVGNPEFLLLVSPPALILLALAYHRRSGTGRRRAAVAGGLFGVAVLLGSYHLAAVIAPQADPHNNPAWVRSLFLQHHSQPRDLLLISGAGDFRAEKFYLRYLGRKRLVLEWKILTSGADGAVVSLQNDLAEARESGTRVLVTSDLFDASSLEELKGRYGFEPAAVDAILLGWGRRAVASLPGGFTLWELLPPSPAPPAGAPQSEG